MNELLPGSWGPELFAYGQQNPLRVVVAVLGVSSLALTLIFGRPSLSGDGTDFSGFDVGDSDGGCGD